MRREGWLLVDHSASPGLPEDVARAAGYDPTFVREGKRYETATLTCAHCKSTVVPNPQRTRERAKCFKCLHYICDGCAFRASLPDYDHAPYERRVELVMAGKPDPLGSPRKLILG
jgi:hypothetical protein